MNLHFKKTAIALAVLSIGSALSTASATSTDQPVVLDETNGPLSYTVTNSTTLYAGNYKNVTISGAVEKEGVLTFITPINQDRKSYKNGVWTYGTPAPAFVNNNFNLTVEATQGNALHVEGYRSQVTFGAEAKEGMEGSSYNDVVQTKSKYGYSNKLTFKSKDGHAIYVNGLDSSVAADLDSHQHDVVIFARRTFIETESKDKAAVYLTGSSNTQGVIHGNAGLKFMKSETWGDDPLQRIEITSPNMAIVMDNGAMFESHAEKLIVNGNVKLTNGSWIYMGHTADITNSMPQSWKTNVDEEFFDPDYNFIAHSISITGAKHSTEPTLSVSKGSNVLMAAKDITIAAQDNANGGNKENKIAAIYIKTDISDTNVGEDFTQLPTVVTIYGTESVNIHGNIVLDANQNAKSLNLIDIRSDGDLKVSGSIYVTNDGSSNNAVKLKLKKNQSLEGVIEDFVEDSGVAAASEVPMLFSLARTAPEPAESVQGVFLTMEEGSTWNMTGNSTVSDLTIETEAPSMARGIAVGAATIDAGTHNLKINNLVFNKDLTLTATTPKAKQFTIGNLTQTVPALMMMSGDSSSGPALNVVYDTIPAYMSGADVAKGLSFDKPDQNPGFTIIQNEGSSSPTREIVVGAGADKEIVSDNQESNTSVSESLNDVASLQVLSWIAQINDVNKRLGDLRSYPNQHGAWARTYGGQMKYGDRGLKYDHNTIQIGADTRIADNFYFGLAASYTEGEGQLKNGKNEDKSYSLGVYGGWMAENGQFADVIVKHNHFDNDFEMAYTTGAMSKGSYDTNGWSICAEYGWRLGLTDKFWVEPQAEVSYGVMNDVSYTTDDGVTAKQDKLESLVGRLGVALGANFEHGSAYVKASVAHQAMGKARITMSNGLEAMEEDLGSTWGEFAIGGTYNIAKNFAVYGEFQTTTDSKLKSPYQWNFGARYMF